MARGSTGDNEIERSEGRPPVVQPVLDIGDDSHHCYLKVCIGILHSISRCIRGGTHRLAPDDRLYKRRTKGKNWIRSKRRCGVAGWLSSPPSNFRRSMLLPLGIGASRLKVRDKDHYSIGGFNLYS
ncbi:conserved hypothetical protein [Ricinus communis]|uniref:Uncharacterized protein n=1 Tax=Ricinus communis TaxID=3988 RepID=B9TIX6_RICCO|nr:conserved hypothetical protein [Ricinus communis]